LLFLDAHRSLEAELGTAALLTPFVRLAVRRGVDDNLATLKAIVEGRR